MRFFHHAGRSLPGRIAISGLLLASFLAVVSGCGRNDKVVELDPRFSMNVARVPSWFPDEKTQLSRTQTEVYERFGQPDYIRFWWDRDGEFITSSDLSGKSEQLPDMLKEMKRTWIYLDDEYEIEFKEEGGYLRHPLTEQLKLVCKYGDPSDKTTIKFDSKGRKMEKWTWIEHGLEIEFMDGYEISRRYPFEGTGRGTWGLK